MIKGLTSNGFRFLSEAIDNFEFGNYFFRVIKPESRNDSLEVDLDLERITFLDNKDYSLLVLFFRKVLSEWINLYGEEVFNAVRYQILNQSLIWELNHRLNQKNLELRKSDHLDLNKISRKILKEW